MKKLNKKGFTLVELLAVIVLLAILAIIAYASIGNVIQTSKNKAFRDSLDAVVNTIKTKIAVNQLESGSETIICSSTDKCDKYYDLNDTDYDLSNTKISEVKDTSNNLVGYEIILKGSGQFANVDTSNQCPVATATGTSVTMATGVNGTAKCDGNTYTMYVDLDGKLVK